jgi:hypothetical protein
MITAIVDYGFSSTGGTLLHSCVRVYSLFAVSDLRGLKMQFKYLVLAAALSVGVVACTDSSMMNSASSQSTLRLTSNTIALSGSDTSKSIQASLTCGCTFMMEQMKTWGDTSCIHFNRADLGTMRSQQNVVATVDPSRATAPHMSACLSFMVNDRMMGTMCRDTVKVDYYR